MSTQLIIPLLNNLSNSAVIDISRNNDLETVAKKLQIDEPFRKELGLQLTFWTDLVLILKKVVKDGLDPVQIEQLMFLFRIIRNSVAGVSENQDRARDSGLIEPVLEVISQAAHTHYGNQAYIMMLRAGVQVLSNLLTGNDKTKDRMWNLLLVKPPSPSCDQSLLSTLAAIEDETIVLSTVVLCYNCIFESKERSDLLFSTRAGKKLVVQLLNESHASSNNEERKSFEMIYTFFDHLIVQGYFTRLFGIIQNPEDDDGEEYRIKYHGEDFYKKEKEEPIPKIQELRIEEIEDEEEPKATGTSNSDVEKKYLSSEQVVLLKMIDSKIYSHHERQQKLRNEVGYSPLNAKPAVSLEIVRSLTEIFSWVSALTIEIFKTLDQPGVGKHNVENLANLSTGLMMLLGCFSHLSLYDDGVVGHEADEDTENIQGPPELVTIPDWFKAQHREMVSGNLVESSIELLRQADKSLARVTKPVASSTTTSSSTTPSMSANSESTLLSNTSTQQGQQSFFTGLKRDIVKLVGNLAYHSRHVQDLIRQCNGLIVMLSQCNIDDANPYLREYAILAMKNILEGNPENQALIEELQPIEAVDHPALQEAKIASRLDAEGRPVLSPKK
ncbi:hypothetical protein BGZ76_010783 [Entomortierella beljakovae]|nr:hypothetical protein BGZ76_010783 [Entomortierella beljakovae]